MTKLYQDGTEARELAECKEKPAISFYPETFNQQPIYKRYEQVKAKKDNDIKALSRKFAKPDQDAIELSKAPNHKPIPAE